MLETSEDYDRILGFTVSFVLLGVALPLIYLPLPLQFDEAIFVVTGNQIAEGNALYGDLHDHKPPGIFYVALAGEWFATAFRQQIAFLAHGDALVTEGLSVYVLRLWTYGVIAVTGLLVYDLGRRVDDEATGMAASPVFLLAMYLPHFEGYHFMSEPWAILPTVAAAILLLEDRTVSDAAAGGALGIGVLFNQTVFLFGLAFVAFCALRLRYPDNRSREYVLGTVRRLGVIGVGFAVPVSLVAGFFYGRGLLNELLYYSFYLPLSSYSIPFEMRGRVLVLLSLLPVWLLAIGLAAHVGVRLSKGREADDRVLFVVLWAVFISYTGATAFDAQHHVLFLFPPVALLAVIGGRRLLDAAAGGDRRVRPSSNRWTPRTVSMPSILLSALVVTLVVSAGFNGLYAGNVLGDTMHDQVTSSQEVDERVDGMVYSWPQRHYLYYFSDDLEPGSSHLMNVYSETVSGLIIDDLEQNRVEYVVVEKGHVDEDNEIAAEKSKWYVEEKRELVAYLNRNYEPVDGTEAHVIFRRTGG